MTQQTVNEINEMLNNPIFNKGLPRPAGANICYINSLVVALRCILNLLRLVIDSRLYFYYSEFENEYDVLFGLHMLVKAMVEDMGVVTETIVRRRNQFINILTNYSDRIQYADADDRPIPPNNGTGDPMELLAFLKDWLQESCGRIIEREVSQQPTDEKRLACDQASVVANRLLNMLGNDLMPELTDANRCVNGHISERRTRTFLQVQLIRRYQCFSDALDDFFKSEEIEKSCERCGIVNCKARKGYRIEQFPEKLLVVGITYGLGNNRNGLEVQRTRLPKIDKSLYLDKYYNANGDICSRRDQPLDTNFVYELRSVILRQGNDLKNSHYTTLCRNLQTNSWQWFDDAHVVEVDIDLDLFISQKSCIYPVGLFYERLETRSRITITNRISRVISKELSRMSLDEQPANQQMDIDWEEDFDRIHDLDEAAYQLNNSIEITSTYDGSFLEPSIPIKKEFEEEEETLDELSSSATSQNISRDVSKSSSCTRNSRKGRKKQSANARRKSNADCMRKLRNKTDYYEKEKINRKIKELDKRDEILAQKRDYMKEFRNDHQSRKKQQQENTISRKEVRNNSERREIEQFADTIRRQERRTDIDWRLQEQKRDSQRRNQKRIIDEEFRKNERIADRFRRYQARNSEKGISEKYFNGIKECTEYVCTCCGGLFFRRSVKEYNQDDIKNMLDEKYQHIYQPLCRVHIQTNDKLWICVTCLEYVRERHEIPTLCLDKNLSFPHIHHSINTLNDTEERLCSPRIAFIRIMPLKWDRQKGLRGNVVNVPIDVNDTITTLPRPNNKAQVIQVNLMRRMNYNRAYMIDKVNPKKIVTALHYLKNSELFQSLDIQLDNDYFQKSECNNLDVDFIADVSDQKSQGLNYKDESENYDDDDLSEFDKAVKLYDDDDENDKNDDDSHILDQQIQQTMIISDGERGGCDLIKIAPGQNSSPVSLMHDEYAEEATFLKIFGGKLMINKIDGRVTLQARCKSFFRRYDRRCSNSIPYIFYMYRKLMAQKLTSAINICLKKSSLKGRRITAQEALEQTKIIEQMDDNDYQKFMSSIRSSPEYWSVKKKQMFAMIRQLGCPSFFITLSPAEIDWPELIYQLFKINEPEEFRKRNFKVEDVLHMSRNEKIELVSRDPVTTARYFENRIRHLINYMFNKQNGPFKEDPIVDFFWRIEFQSRGSPHVHMLVWMKDRPIYKVGTPLNSEDNCKIIELIDRYISCESPLSTKTISEEIEKDSNAEFEFERQEYDELQCLIKFQRHVHKSNCLVESSLSRINAYAFGALDCSDENDHDEIRSSPNCHLKFCKYGFPWPILDRTVILDPLQNVEGKVFASGKSSQDDNDAKIVENARKNFFHIKQELDKMAREQDKARKNKSPLPKEITMGEFLDKLDLLYDEYMLALRASINTPTVFLKRTSYEIMLNPYNKKIFLKHQANMDIQFVLNSYGVAVYLTSYLMKSHAFMNRLLRVAQVELRNKRNMNLKQKLVQIASKFQNCSEISAQECVYHLLSMPVSYSTRDHVFIITFKEEDRFTMLKPKRYLRLLQDNDTNVFMSSIQEKYVCRPRELEDICLAEFVAGFNLISCAQMKNRQKGLRLPTVQEDEDDLDDDELEQMNNSIELEPLDGDEDLCVFNNPNNNTIANQNKRIFKLDGNMGYVERRQKLRIIRYRRFNKESMPWEHYREQLMLFMPWRNELNQVQVDETFEEYKKHSYVIASNRRKFEHLVRNETEAEALDRMEREIEEQEDLNYAIKAAEQNRIDDVLMGRQERIDPNIDNDELIDHLEDQHNNLMEMYEEETGYHGNNLEEERNAISKVQPLASSEKEAQARRRMSDDEYKKFMNRLNKKQHTFLLNCLNKIKLGEAFHELVIGESGTGKSNLIRAIDQCVNRYMRKKDNDEPEKNRVILCSFTGKASFNIGGVTLHSAFHLPVKASEMAPMSMKTCAETQKAFSKLELIIIDEVSMIGCTLFNWVNQRLQQIYENQLPFGGKSVVFFGDFNQLHPVMDNWIFDDRIQNDEYRDLVRTGKSSLWSIFRIFRLNEIMRQAGDKRFAEALTTLGRLGLCGLSDQDISLFDSRIVNSLNDIPDDAIFLYHTNEKKNAMCEIRLKKKPGETFNNQAKHIARGEGKDLQIAETYIRSHAMHQSIAKCTGLANVLLLKEGIQYMLFTNQDVSDGLVNGTTGTLRAIEKFRDTEDNKERAQFLWIEFSDENVGLKMRTKYAHLYKEKRINNQPVPQNWTPLFPITASYRVRSSNKWAIDRIQFAIDIAEAITIDKAQGQTYPRVAIDLNQTSKKGHNTLTRAHLYVALSRVRRLEDLYLFGLRSIVEGKQHEFWEEKRRKKLAEENIEKEATHAEMKRMLKESPFVNRFPFTELDKTQLNSRKSLAICMQNVANLRSHIDCIKADYGMMNADVLLLVETATKTCEKSIKIKQHNDRNVDQNSNPNYYGECKIENFRLVHMGSSREREAKIGCALYVSNRLDVNEIKFIGDNSRQSDGVYHGNNICELAMFGFRTSYGKVCVIYGYNHPESTLKNFYKVVKHFMKACQLDVEHNASNKMNAYLIGDFNIDLKKGHNREEKKIFEKMQTKLGLQLLLPNNQTYSSTDRDTCIDWCMTNNDNQVQHSISVYESWYSDHKPLWIEILK